jgi:hypothetical protein
MAGELEWDKLFGCGPEGGVLTLSTDTVFYTWIELLLSLYSRRSLTILTVVPKLFGLTKFFFFKYLDSDLKENCNTAV